MTLSVSARSLALFGAASALALLLDQPAQAHGIAHGGIAAGFLHQISGVDHLLLLVGIGAAASCISAQLLLWALAGAIGGGVFGAMGGTLPAQEFLAALAITAVAVLVLRSLRSQQSPQLGACAALVAGGLQWLSAGERRQLTGAAASALGLDPWRVCAGGSLRRRVSPGADRLADALI
jgi:urease accessory protein